MEPHALMLAAAVITLPPLGPEEPLDGAGEVVVAHPVMLSVTARTATETTPRRRCLTAPPFEGCDVLLSNQVASRTNLARSRSFRGAFCARIGVFSAEGRQYTRSGIGRVRYLEMNIIAKLSVPVAGIADRDAAVTSPSTDVGSDGRDQTGNRPGAALGSSCLTVARHQPVAARRG